MLGACLILGVVQTLRVLDGGEALTPAIVVLLVGLFQAKAATVTAALILVVTAVVALRRRPLHALVLSRVPRAIVAIVGTAHAVVGVVLLGYGGTSAGLASIGVGGALLAVSAIRGRQPWPAAGAALALVIAIAAVEIPLELEVWSVSWTRSQTSTDHHMTTERSCEGPGTRDQVNLRALTRRVVIDPRLTGDIGERVTGSIGPHYARENGELLVTVDGDIAGSGVACWVPLFKWASLETSLRFEGTVANRGASCTVNGRIDLTIDAWLLGISSCAGFHKHLAQQIEERLTKQLGGLAE
jgi:hypothetical protein